MDLFDTSFNKTKGVVVKDFNEMSNYSLAFNAKQQSPTSCFVKQVYNQTTNTFLNICGKWGFQNMEKKSDFMISICQGHSES